MLSKGAIEAYYLDGVAGGDKPSRALSACQRIASLDDIRNICTDSRDATEDNTEVKIAFEYLFA